MTIRSAALVAMIASLTGCISGHPTRETVRIAPTDDAAAARVTAAIDTTITVDVFAACTFRHGGVTLPYRLLAPALLAPGIRYPLVLVLHGSGVMGDDNRAQLGPFARSWARPELRNRFPAFVVVPHFATRTAVYSIDARDSLPSSEGTAALDAALALIMELLSTHPIDSSRVYVVGFSMGASAAWNALVGRPGLFAAAITIAGVPPPRAMATFLAASPLLIAHGTADVENPIAADRAMYTALRGAGARSLRFREYIGLDHRVPPDFFSETTWHAWLFAQRRRSTQERALTESRHAVPGKGAECQNCCPGL